MKRFDRCILKLWLLSIGLTAAGILLIGNVEMAWSIDSSGMSLVLRVPDEQKDLHYLLGADNDPVTVIMSLCNETGKPLATERAFSNMQLYHALIVIDPKKNRHVLRPEEKAHKMEQPYILNNLEWDLAQELPAKLPSGSKYCSSATISDLRELVEVMKTTPGTYKIIAQMPFVRFAATGQDPGLGLIGLLNNDQNWTNTIHSKNYLEIFIDPPAGAQFKVQVLDASTDPAGTPFQVPVKVYKTEDADNYSSLQDTWDKALPLIEKTTDTQGQAILTFGSGCLSQGNYTIIANYSEEFKESLVTASESGWVTGSCSGEIAKEIEFTGVQEPEPVAGDLDGDGDVDMDDFYIFISAFGKCEGQDGYNDIVDYDGDNCITFVDYQIWYGYFMSP